MIRLADMILPEKIVDLDSEKHDAVLDKLIAAAMPDASPELCSIAHEEIRSKSHAKEMHLGHGFALSHARLDDLINIEISLGLFGKETRYLKGENIHSVFCIMIPTDKARAYLMLMARFSRFLLQPKIADTFMFGNHDTILRAFREFDAG